MTADKNSIMWSTSTMDMTSQELHDITIALPENMFLPDLNNELAYLNEEETTDIAVKSEQIYTATVMVPTIPMPFVPISPLGPPTRGDFAGQFNFEVQVNGDDTHKKKYLYSYTMNRIYVDQNCNFPMQFKWNHAMAPQQMLVRATAVFSDESQSEYKVKRCLQHVHPSNNTNSLGDICYHVLHSAREPGMDGVFYCGQDKDNSWYSVVVQFPMQPDVGALTFSHVYKFVCKHTCASGINRRPIEVIFTLENFCGDVYGRQSVGARVCSCPGRDMRKDEQSAPTPADKKRKSNPEQPPAGKKVKLEVEPTDADDTKIFTLPRSLQIVGCETFKAGLNLFMNYMISHAAQSTNEATYQIYEKPIADIKNLLDSLKKT